jgi:hypothetical protein
MDQRDRGFSKGPPPKSGRSSSARPHGSSSPTTLRSNLVARTTSVRFSPVRTMSIRGFHEGSVFAGVFLLDCVAEEGAYSLGDIREHGLAVHGGHGHDGDQVLLVIWSIADGSGWPRRRH